LLNELDEQHIADHTVVVLWGDHGFHLGEQGLWTKANNYELATRVPLIICVPGLATADSASDAIVELVDVYPTLADICGLATPGGLEGTSLKPLLIEPDRAWKHVAFSQFPRARKGNRHRGHGNVMGYALRTRRHRYVEWQEWHSKKVLARELYDHDSDPHELINLANRPNHAEVVQEMAGKLGAGWRAALPNRTQREVSRDP